MTTKPLISPEGANPPKGARWAPDPALTDQLAAAEWEHTAGYGVKAL